MTWKLYAAAALALVVAFAFGRWSAPKPLERDHIVTSERDTELSFHAYVGHTITIATSETKWRTITKWEPSGEVVQVRELARSSETKTEQTQTDTSKHEQTAELHQDLEHERKPAHPGPDWLVAARAGVDLKLSPILGASVSRRILGPVYLEAWGARPWAGGLGIGLAF